jgi:hypothetical protein
VIPADPEIIQLAYQEEEHKAKALMDEMTDFISKNQAKLSNSICCSPKGLPLSTTSNIFNLQNVI